MSGSSDVGVGRGRLLLTLALAQMLIGIDYNIVFVALPRIADLGFADADLQWVISAYAIAFGGLLLLSGRLVDRLGRRRLFLAGVGLFAAGSVIGGLATGPTLLIVGRAVQGVGGAALAPATLALLAAHFREGPERHRALGIWGAAGSSGMVLGSILGGALTDGLGWRAVFLVNLPITAVILVLTLVSVEPHRPTPSAAPVDVVGAILTTATAVGIVMGLTSAAEGGWSAPLTLICLISGALLLALLLRVESRVAAPLFDVRRFRNRHLATGTATTFLFMAGFGSIAYFLTLYFQHTRGLSPMVTGLAFVLPCAGVLVGTRVGGRWPAPDCAGHSSSASPSAPAGV